LDFSEVSDVLSFRIGRKVVLHRFSEFGVRSEFGIVLKIPEGCSYRFREALCSQRLVDGFPLTA
jgi:hypothetical protein